MSAYSHAGRPEEVLRLFRSLPFPPTAPLFTTLISSLADSGHYRAARAAFSSLLVSGHQPTVSTFTAMLKAHGPVSANGVYHIFGAMIAAGCAPDAAAYNCLISILCDNQRVEEALGILEFMADNEIRPTIRSYTAVLRGYCEQGMVLEAERFVDTMIQVGCPPDVISYSVLIEGLCRVGEFSKVERILGESEEKGWTPNAVTYNIYMSALCRMGLSDEAFRQVDVMCSRGLSMTIETVNILFDCLCRDSRFSEAVCLLEYSGELGWEVDVFCYNTLMSRLCEVGDFARVLKLLVDLMKKGIGPDMFSFTIAIRSLCGAGKFQLAKYLLDNERMAYDVVAFNTLIHGLCVVGDLHGVIQIYMDMISRNVAPNNFTIAMVIDSLCKQKKFLTAINFLVEPSVKYLVPGQESLGKYLVPDHFVRLTNWLVKAKGLGYVLIFLRKMRAKGLVLDVCVFNSLVRIFCWEGYCRRDNFYEVSLILDSMLDCLSSQQTT
jgi:pentatricopeptide repeat protein